MQKDVKYVASAVSPQEVDSTKATTARATTATVSAGYSQAKLPTAFAPSHAKYKCQKCSDDTQQQAGWKQDYFYYPSHHLVVLTF